MPTAAGSSMDVLARLIQDLWQRNQLVTTTMTVQPRPGGGGALAWSYVSQKAGDGHYLAISGPTLLANDVLKIGNLRYQDVTPIAQLFTEYGTFAVNANSTIRTGKDLALALAGPKPPSVAIAPGQGSSSHVALLRLARAAGIDPNKLTIVPFKGANESVTAVLGGHIDVVIATMSVLDPHLAAGKLRPIALAAPQRLAGQHANIPTWKEQGLDVVEGNWRGVVGPKNSARKRSRSGAGAWPRSSRRKSGRRASSATAGTPISGSARMRRASSTRNTRSSRPRSPSCGRTNRQDRRRM